MRMRVPASVSAQIGKWAKHPGENLVEHAKADSDAQRSQRPVGIEVVALRYVVDGEANREVRDLENDERKKQRKFFMQFPAQHHGRQAHKYGHRCDPQDVVNNPE